MTEFIVKKDSYVATTDVPDNFIENFMPDANGDHVKIYLYLIFCLKKSKPLSVSSLADLFQCKENDIVRAFRYWEGKGLLYMEKNSSGEVISISLNDFSRPEAAEQNNDSDIELLKRPVPEKHNYTPAETAAFKQHAEVKELLFVCEQYIGKPLTMTDLQTLLYFYEELHFSTDLIEYLVEYSVSKGKRSLRYMEKVALSWHEKGITTVESAKLDSKPFARECYLVLKAFGINNHDPLPSEVHYVNRWLNELQLPIELILEACTRTMMKIHKPEFKYADKILTEWKASGVRHLSDINALDAAHKNRRADRKPEASDKAFTTRFHNFEQHTYDFDELEKKLFIN